MFLVFTADMTLEEPKQTAKIPTEYENADDFGFWRIGVDFYHPSVNTNTICYIQCPDLVPKMANISISKTNYIFYDKKKLLTPPSIPVTINESLSDCK